MAIFSFFGGTKNRKFDYIPRYFNPEKEKLEKAMEKYKQKETSPMDDVKMNIKAGLRMRTPYNKTFNIKSNFLVFAVMIVLIFLTIYLISAYMPLLLGFEG